ncbi:MAG: TMEM175 family protein [Acidimicrobiia bacterium]
MSRHRLEAFSDGVIAILITIMVLELRPPEGTGIADLRTVLPKVAAYLLSFVLVGIYWNNHHHLFQVVERVDGAVLWANLALLFSLSLVSFATAWFGEHPGNAGPVFWYAVVQLLCALSYAALTFALLRIHAPDTPLGRAIGRDRKGKVSLVAYVVGVAAAPWVPWLTVAVIGAVAVLWLVPDRRVVRITG